MLWSNQPEYLQLFSNDGPVKVSVKFSDKSDKHRSMASMSMHWHEFECLINQDTGVPYTSMYLDTHLCSIKRFEIDPAKNCLTIIIGKTGLP